VQKTEAGRKEKITSDFGVERKKTPHCVKEKKQKRKPVKKKGDLEGKGPRKAQKALKCTGKKQEQEKKKV